MSFRRVKIVVQYDGAPFRGWQAQQNGVSLQQTLEEALGKMLERRVQLVAAGRTDAGVHAAAMPVHFDLDHSIPTAKLPIAMSKFLPPAISILSAEDAPVEFDARRSARLRWYRYQILLTPLRQPLGPRAWQFHHRMDVEKIEAGLALLRGHHDFSGFRSSQCQSKRTELTMQEARLTRVGNLLAIDFKCRSFLHHMVRFMVGTVAAMGRGQIDKARLLRIRDEGVRPELIYCAPPHGLCLMGVAYTPEEIEAMLAANPVPPSF